VSEAIQLVAVAGIPVAFVITLVRGGWARSTGAEDLSIRLGDEHGTTRDALARALGDDSVRLLPEAPASVGTARGLLPLSVDGRDLGAIEYDARLLTDGLALQAAASMVAVSLDRARLVEEQRDAGERMVEAADRERARIARDLHDGLQAKLVLLALQADGAPDGRVLRDELTGAVDDLRAFVQGIMPAALIERGLDAAVEDLADRMPVPTAVRIDLGGRPLPDAVESTAYFLVAEACANTVKHAGAHVASIDVQRHDGTLLVSVADDGTGGAQTGHGLGLRGLRDRVDALGGELRIVSPPQGGTRLTAELPCG
jgi:signal transduction histidine kinase